MGASFALVVTSLYKRYKKQSEINIALVREQNHRVKNNLQSVSALLELQALRMNDPAARSAIEESSQRLHALSLIQKRLYGNEVKNVNLDEFVNELAENLLLSFGFTRSAKDVKIEVAQVKVDLAIPIGLIVNELLTNSCKHAWNNHPNPHFKLHVWAPSAQLVRLAYSDNGNGFDAAKMLQSANSFGLQLIDMQVRQMNGSYKWYNHEGSAIEIDIPNK